jgi:LuxR family maltose regulon positive regulatory protein
VTALKLVHGATAPSGAWAAFEAGLAQSHAADAGALAALSAAYALMCEAGDARGRLLSAAALVVTGHMAGNFRGMPEWLAVVAAVKQPPVKQPPAKQPPAKQPPAKQPHSPAVSADDELLARTACLIGQLYFELQDPDVDRNAARLVELLERPTGLDVNLRLAAARILLYYVDPRELRELGQRISILVQPHLSDPALTPHRHGQWLLRWRNCLGYAKEASQADAVTEAARRLAERHGLRDVQFGLAFDEVGHSLNGGELTRAERALQQAEALVDGGSLVELMLLDVTRMRVALLKGQVDDALFRAARARRYAVELQCPGPMMGAYIVNEANVRLLTNDWAGARSQMEQALPLLPDGFAREVREMIAMIAAFEALERGEPGGRAMMAAVWADLRQRQFYDSFDGHPDFRARVCMQALEQHIEVDFVTSLIRKCGLAPPDGASEAWPWPLRIHALGRFTVQRDGIDLPIEGKGQRKPLELLRALVAHNATSAARALPAGELIDMLWPDLEADAPKASLDMALMRLRKLLQVDGAVRLAEGRVWLDPRSVWCDVTAFEQDCDALVERTDRANREVALSAAAHRLRLRHASRLFGAGPAEPWAVAPRERLARKLARAIGEYGQHLEAEGAWVAAISLYEYGVAQDMCAEPYYRGLMRAYLALDQPAAAQRCFHRCRDLLATVLKVPPSAETLAMVAQIPTV